MPDFKTILIALAAGLLPALLWLAFWLREDKKHPEPKSRLITTFLCGMLAVPAVLPFQELAKQYFENYYVIMFLLWAATEEILKYLAAYFSSLRTTANDEPIDALIYMITSALGFVALENTLFLIEPLRNSQITETIITGNLRFVGSSLLHIISSATIGIFIAFSLHKNKELKKLYVVLGILLAIVLHTSFNLFIISIENSATFVVFGFVWLSIIILILFFEKIKNIKKEAINN